LSVEAITHWLTEKKGIKGEVAKTLARISGGSLGRALNMWDQDFLKKRQEWLYKLIQLPILSKEDALTLALQCASMHKQSELHRPHFEQEDFTAILHLWEAWYRDLIIVKVNASDRLLINLDYSQELKNTAKNCKLDHLINSMAVLESVREDLRRQMNPVLVMVRLLLRLKQLAVS
jgi:DNA polymerase-3 subunit delta'